MKRFTSLLALSATASAISCDGIGAFEPAKPYARGSTVIFDGEVYAAAADAAPVQSPKASASWLPIGTCSGAQRSPVKQFRESPDLDEIDCAGVSPYQAKVYDKPNTKVYLDGVMYHNKWYADVGNSPTKGDPWEADGNCKEGSMGEGDVTLVDCSDAFPYVAKVYPEPNVKVYLDGVMYHNKWYAEGGSTPTKGDPWEADGKCKEGSMGEGAVVEVDCTGIPAWSGALTYSEGGNKVHSGGNLFMNKWWSEGDKPREDFVDGPWHYEARCQKGTDTGKAPSSPYDITEEKARLLCNCCQKCGKLNNLGPVCLDTVESEETCYFAWCPKYNNYNAETCKHVLDTHQLFYYAGEMPPGQVDWPNHVYIPYIDGGLAQQPPIDELADQLGVKYFVLAFAQSGVSETTVGCQGAIASVIPIQEGPFSWNSAKGANDLFWERVANLRKKGGDITLSFGGAMGIELADSPRCTKSADGSKLSEPQIVDNLKNAYKEAIDFLKLTHLDFDIEGMAVSSVNRETGWQYRFKAVKALEAEYPDLKVWWTLPILPQGLTLDGMNFIEDLFESGVRVDKINVMTMDYGDNIVCPNDDMHACEVMAVDALAKQVFDAANAKGVASKYGFTSKDDVYPFIGSTPMIGLNDVTTETYSLQNAKDSMNVWKTTNRKLGIISNWSLTRDHPCSTKATDCLCSSNNNQDEDYEFARIFAEWTGYSG